jgi:hypothetical protein
MNDIMILKLARPVSLDQNVQVACLPSFQSETFPAPDQPAYLVGWGKTSFPDGQYSQELRNIKLQIYNQSACAGTLSFLSFPGYNASAGLCAGWLPGGKDTCQSWFFKVDIFLF